MESDSKRVKENENEENETKTTKTKELPKAIIKILTAALEDEELDDNKLSFHRKRLNDEMIPKICEWVTKIGGDKIKKLDLSLTHLTSHGLSILLDALTTSSIKITNMNLIVNKIDDEGMETLGKYTQQSNSIEYLDIASNKITDKGVEILDKYMDEKVRIKEISLLGNDKITDASVPIFMKWIETTKIIHIDLTNTSITNSKLIYHPLWIKQSLMDDSKENVYISGEISNETMHFVCKILKKFGIEKKKEFGLGSFKLTQASFNLVIETLKEYHPKLANLIFYSIEMTDEWLKPLCEYIQYNDAIEKLDVSGNRITNKGMEILSECLTGKSNLIFFYFGKNPISDACLPHLQKLVGSSSLRYVGDYSLQFKLPVIVNAMLDIKNKNFINNTFCNITDDEMNEFCNCLRTFGTREIRELQFRNYKVSSKGASLLFETLKECKLSINSLYLRISSLDDCIQPFMDYLVQDESLENLDLNSNNLSDKSIELLSNCLSGNTKLKKIWLRDNPNITNESFLSLMRLAKTSCIEVINLNGTSLTNIKQEEINEAIIIPNDQRELPIKSNTKSAAKTGDM